MKNYKKIKNIIWKLTGVLFSLVLFSTYFSAGLAAKYISRAEGEDSARVAKFNYTLTAKENLLSQPLDISLAPSGTYEVNITLENTSEVALRCVITAENLTKNLPIFYDTNEKVYKPSVSEVGVPVGGTGTVTFSVTWPEVEGLDDPSYAGKVDNILLTISVEQVD